MSSFLVGTHLRAIQLELVTDNVLVILCRCICPYAFLWIYSLCEYCILFLLFLLCISVCCYTCTVKLELHCFDFLSIYLLYNKFATNPQQIKQIVFNIDYTSTVVSASNRGWDDPVRISLRCLASENQSRSIVLDPMSSRLVKHRLDGQTGTDRQRQTDKRTRDDSIYRAVINQYDIMLGYDVYHLSSIYRSFVRAICRSGLSARSPWRQN